MTTTRTRLLAGAGTTALCVAVGVAGASPAAATTISLCDEADDTPGVENVVEAIILTNQRDDSDDLRGTERYERFSRFVRDIDLRLGDVNNDGTISALDASLAQDIATGEREADPCAYLVADYDLSGFVVPTDTYLISLASVGLA